MRVRMKFDGHRHRLTDVVLSVARGTLPGLVAALLLFAGGCAPHRRRSAGNAKIAPNIDFPNACQKGCAGNKGIGCNRAGYFRRKRDCDSRSAATGRRAKTRVGACTRRRRRRRDGGKNVFRRHSPRASHSSRTGQARQWEPRGAHADCRPGEGRRRRTRRADAVRSRR